MDQASDIAAIMEFYELFRDKNKNICEELGVNTGAYFGASIFAFSFYILLLSLKKLAESKKFLGVQKLGKNCEMIKKTNHLKKMSSNDHFLSLFLTQLIKICLNDQKKVLK